MISRWIEGLKQKICRQPNLSVEAQLNSIQDRVSYNGIEINKKEVISIMEQFAPTELDVQDMKEALDVYPMWVNESEVIARGLASKGFGSLERQKAEYEEKIATLQSEIEKRESRIKEVEAYNKCYARMLTEIRELTCQAVGIDCTETTTGNPAPKTDKRK